MYSFRRPTTWPESGILSPRWHYAAKAHEEQLAATNSGAELTNRPAVFYDAPMETPSIERFEIAINTPAGRLNTTLDVPTGFVPITSIVPVTRRLGEEMLKLEELRSREAGHSISCRMGCAACCRMLVPLSAPEAFALREYVEQLPEDRRTHLLNRLSDRKDSLKRAGLWDRLNDVAEASRSVSDEELDPINRSYYALRIPCPYLENEMCSIYEARPSACRELLVTSPAELCQDMVQNPVAPLPVSMRMSSILGIAWGTLTNSPPRLIPLP